MKLLALSIHLVLALQVSGQTTCRRKPPGGNDCSTVMANCSIPTQEGPMQIPYPEENTRSCYRTCITLDNKCEINRIAFENKPLRRSHSLTGGFSVMSITSPNFRNLRPYRKSTICRYHAACSPGQILSYVIESHALEPPVMCEGEQVCVDSLTITGNSTSAISCGVLSEDEIVSVDSGLGLLVEFKSNRKIEDRGFRILVSCVNTSEFENKTERMKRENDATTKFHSTVSEKKAILRLMRRMAVEINNEEELDMLDTNGRAPQSSNPRFILAEERRLRRAALYYGSTARNGLLRATACAYQELIMGRKCM